MKKIKAGEFDEKLYGILNNLVSAIRDIDFDGDWAMEMRNEILELPNLGLPKQSRGTNNKKKHG